ncbi:hypothetical protein Scep_016470 [Stephania cephalantha]|uniref:AB hydrolase-1 domain-containing protein n=1 Tax=Stephania cephalantha TaxID=152367 RepID=A0AAP0IMW6_9MAGN
MGNLYSSCCCSPKKPNKKSSLSSKRFSSSTAQPGLGGASNRWSRIRSSRRERSEDELIQEQAIAAALLFQHHQQNGTLPLSFDRSASLRYPAIGSKKQQQQNLPRSSSSRARSVGDALIQPHQLLNQECWRRGIIYDSRVSDPDQELKVEDLETNHIVLVHGGGFGAWCWYKTITLLEEGGFKVDAVDLTGSGVHSFDTNRITSLGQYVKPLTDLLEKLGDGKKVILLGHDFGGACISYAMELFPSKVAKAVFVAAAMLNSGQSTLDMFSQQANSNDLMRQAQIFLYANGNDQPPTAIDLSKSLLRDLLFGLSPAKDVALASVSMRPIPFAPVLEKLSLSKEKYGSVRRFYIETSDDECIPLSLQQSMINSNTPEQVFRLKGSDHSPFFSKPQALHKLLVEISKIPRKKSND